MRLGRIALIGSGETAASSGRVYETLVRGMRTPVRVSVLETPAGYELNSAQVAGRVAGYLGTRLQNYSAKVAVLAARQQGTPFSPQRLEVVRELLTSDLTFMGPGSPSYAVRQLRGSMAWQFLLMRHRMGASLVFASAAAIAISALALPVYEIYKVGEYLHWMRGLDLLGAFGLPVVVIPHWNNNDGGVELDTSHCFMGKARFEILQQALPADTCILGIDEHTSLVLDFDTQTCEVFGRDAVHVLCAGEERCFASGNFFPLNVLGELQMPQDIWNGLDPEMWKLAQRVLREEETAGQAVQSVPQIVLDLIEQRQSARQSNDWVQSDALRQEIRALGWLVRDTPDGPLLEKI